MRLLSRDEFRSAVFSRDGGRCVMCGEPGVDAHHIVERRLFSDGGYYLDNGATLCPGCHLEAERTRVSPAEIRRAIGASVVLPPHLSQDTDYDKWGNPVLPNGTRMKGELFGDESVQRALREGGALSLFADYVKYPRTPHLPWSNPGQGDCVSGDEHFVGRDVVVTAKMDGENTSCYRDHVHTRSLGGLSHPTQSWMKKHWSEWGWMLDEGMRVCGENLYAVHTLRYAELESYFLAFSVWVGDECLSWSESLEYFGILGLSHVPVIYEGPYDRAAISDAYASWKDGSCEGYVVRLASSFRYGSFRKSVGKFVEAEFKQAADAARGRDWSRQQERNLLHNDSNF